MFTISRRYAAGIAVLMTTACAQNESESNQATASDVSDASSVSAVSYETSVDPGGCLIEHIAVDPTRGQFHFDGLSADGTKLAIGWDRNGEENGLYILDLITGETKDIPGLNNGAVFSPDGTKLLNILPTENGRTDIVEYDIASGEMTFIAPHDQWEWLASYSSDGETILFNSYRTGGSDIYTLRVTDGALTQWTEYDGYDAHGQFSPDDSRILFNRHEGGEDFNLYVIEVASGDITQLTDEGTEESYGSWSPDGSVIVYSSDRAQSSGEPDLYLMTADGEHMRRLTDHPAKDEYSFFSPDGKYIYFSSYRSDPKGMYRMEMDSEMNCVKGDAG